MTDIEKKDATRSNQSTEKAMAIIELLARRSTPMRLRDISDELKLNASTAARFLSSLQCCGYVAQEPESQRYFLTYKICHIANLVSEKISIHAVTHPYLLALSEQFHEALCVSVERDMRMVYVDVASSPDQTLMSLQRIGNVSPMHCTGNGKLLLLNYSDEKLDRLISERGLQQYTEHTITTKDALLKELNMIRSQGFAYDNEECEIGVRCLAYPIRDYTGEIVAGISVTGPITRMTDEAISRIQGRLAEAAERISASLGHENNFNN